MEVKELLELVVQGGSLVVLAGFIYVVFVKLLPQHSEDMQRQRVSFVEAITKAGDDHKTIMTAFHTQFKEHTKQLQSMNETALLMKIKIEDTHGILQSARMRRS